MPHMSISKAAIILTNTSHSIIVTQHRGTQGAASHHSLSQSSQGSHHSLSQSIQGSLSQSIQGSHHSLSQSIQGSLSQSIRGWLLLQPQTLTASTLNHGDHEKQNKTGQSYLRDKHVDILILPGGLHQFF